jgi:molybdopterin converting factor subunit 1
VDTHGYQPALIPSILRGAAFRRPSLRVDVRFFALFRERTGASVDTIQLPDGATSSDLLVLLHDKYPSLPPSDSLMVAVNSQYADRDHPLADGDEVALIPPVSGGHE